MNAPTYTSATELAQDVAAFAAFFGACYVLWCITP